MNLNCGEREKAAEMHTPEPWHFCPISRNESFISSGTEESGFSSVSDYIGTENARRIVAAVNACAGISTDDLEPVSINKVLQMLALEKATYRRQRDELLAALEKVLATRNAEAKASAAFNNAAENYSDDSREAAAYEKAMVAASKAESEARIAIAKVKGQP